MHKSIKAFAWNFLSLTNFFVQHFRFEYALTYPRFFMTDHAGPEQQIAPLLSKSSAWNYEDEFRLISDEKGDPKDTIVTTAGKKDIPSKSLTAVILGCLAPTLQNSQLSKWLRNHDIRLR